MRSLQAGRQTIQLFFMFYVQYAFTSCIESKSDLTLWFIYLHSFFCVASFNIRFPSTRNVTLQNADKVIRNSVKSNDPWFRTIFVLRASVHCC